MALWLNCILQPAGCLGPAWFLLWTSLSSHRTSSFTNMQVLFLPCQPDRQMGEAGAALVTSSLMWKRQHGHLHWSSLFALYEVKQLKEGKKKAMLWNIHCTVHLSGVYLITIHQLASPPQLFLWKAVDFSLVVLSFSVGLIEFLNLFSIWFVSHGCRGSGTRHRMRGDPSAQWSLPSLS